MVISALYCLTESWSSVNSPIMLFTFDFTESEKEKYNRVDAERQTGCWTITLVDRLAPGLPLWLTDWLLDYHFEWQNDSWIVTLSDRLTPVRSLWVTDWLLCDHFEWQTDSCAITLSDRLTHGMSLWVTVWLLDYHFGWQYKCILLTQEMNLLCVNAHHYT